jgi:hypothetical protein
MRALREHIEGICSIRGRSELTLRELTGLIEDLYLEPGTPATPSSRGQAIAPPAASEEDVAAPADAVQSTPSSQETPDATDQAIRRALETPEERPANALTPVPRGSELADLESLMGKRQRQRFLRRLFRRDAEYFGSLLAELNALQTWKDASAYLTRVYEVNRLDPFAEEVIEFTDLVQSRYPGTQP